LEELEIILGFVGLVLVALIGVLQAYVGREVKAVRGQVLNSHSPDLNLRDQIDTLEKGLIQVKTMQDGFTEQMKYQGELIRSQGHQIGEIRDDLRAFTTTHSPNHIVRKI
jgi:hypothetical protein